MSKIKYEVPSVINGIEVLKVTKRNKRGQPFVLAKCPKCGKIWEVFLYSITSGKTTQCPKCGYAIISEKMTKHKTPGVIGKVYAYERVRKTSGGDWIVRCKCSKCGRVDWETAIGDLIKGVEKCEECKRYPVPGTYNGIDVLERLYVDETRGWIVRCKCPSCNKTTWETTLSSITSTNPPKKCLECYRLPVPGVYNGIKVLKRVPDPNGSKRSYVLCECPKCKHDWIVVFTSITSGHSKHCENCAAHVTGNIQIPGTYYNVTIYKKLPGKEGKVVARCPDCGNEKWKPKLYYVVTGRSRRCFKCKAKRWASIGINEKSLLDEQENLYNIKIDRQIAMLGFIVDGYCAETNTVYEVYEKAHDKQIEYDLKRQKEIQDFLNCEFIIIHDRTH